MSFKRSQNIFAKIFLGGVFVFLIFGFSNSASADILLPGDISTCGEMAAPGTYTLTTDINVGSSTSCFVISSSDVVIEPNGHFITANITLQDNGGGSPDWFEDDSTWAGERTWTFNNNSINNGIVTGNTIFNDNSYNNWGIINDAIFNDFSSFNFGIALGNVVFNDSSVFMGTILGNSIFNGNSSIGAETNSINGNITLNTTYYDTVGNTVPTGGVLKINGGNTGLFIFGPHGTIFDSEGNEITQYIIENSGFTGDVHGTFSVTDGWIDGANFVGDASLYGTSYLYYANVTGNVNFYDSSENYDLTITNGSAFFWPGSKNNGTLNGTMYQIPVSSGKIWTNASSDEDWNNSENWIGGIPADGDNIILTTSVTLPYDITNNVYVVSNDIVIDGGSEHYTITGNVNGDGSPSESDIYSGLLYGNPQTTIPGRNFTLQNLTVTGIISANGGNGDTDTGGKGGDITLDNVTYGSIFSNGGVGNWRYSDSGYGGGANGGNGGSITLTNSSGGSIVSNGGIGNISGSDTGYVSGNGGSLQIINSQVGIINSSGGNGSAASGGNGGNVNLDNSIAGNVYLSGGSGDAEFGNGGNGGIFTSTNSTFGNVISGGGFSSYATYGSGGSINISGTIVDLSGKILSVLGFPYTDGFFGPNGNLTISYSGLNTNDQTQFLNIGTLTINNISYIDTNPNNSQTCDNGVVVGVGCAWNGVFNPQVFYFNDQQGNGGRMGDWGDARNWWNDPEYGSPAGSIPTGLNDVIVNNGNITKNSSDYANASTLNLNGSSTISISVNVQNGTNFNDVSTNATSTPSVAQPQIVEITVTDICDETTFNENGFCLGFGTPSDTFDFSFWWDSTMSGAEGLTSFLNTNYSSQGVIASQDGSTVIVTIDPASTFVGEWVNNWTYGNIQTVQTSTIYSNGIGTIISNNPITFNDTASNLSKVFSNVVRFFGDLSSTVLGTIKVLSATGPFVAQNAGNQYWQSITSTPNGDVYAVVASGDIYKFDHLQPENGFVAQNAGNQDWQSIIYASDGLVYAVSGYEYYDSDLNEYVFSGEIYKQTAPNVWEAQGAGDRYWKSITSTPNGDVYAVALLDDIYKQTAPNVWEAQGAGNQYWQSITSTPNGDVYAVVASGDIYKFDHLQPENGFVAQNTGIIYWTSVTSTPNGDVYATTDLDDIYKQTAPNVWEAQGAGIQSWTGITSTPLGDVYAVVWNGDIYKQTAGHGAFVAQEAGSRNWTAVTSTPSGDVYATVNGGDIYKQSALPTAERIYTESSTTTRDFTTEGGVDTWTVIAQRAVGSLVDVVVNITGAIYDLTKNIFKAFTGATFISGTDINNLSTPVVPELIPILPIQNQTVTKWLPSVDWGDTATICEYSYDNWTTTDIATCSNNGSDISRPLGGSHTLTLRSTNEYGSFKEEAIEFTYDNTVPTYTMCGSDLLDESTRPYYYLSENTTGDCTATVNTELRGTSNTNATSTGYTLTGNMIANAKNISLKFINITGTVTTSGTSNGQSAGNITIATSTTGAVYANGANGTGNGGNGGDITITNSISSPLLSAIFANGGDSTSCGNGGDSGEVTLTNSSYGTITNDPGSEENSGCPSSSKTSGTKRNQNVTGTYTAPGSSNNNNNNNNVSTESVSKGGYSKNFIPGQINKVIVPVQDITPLKFTPLPSFGTGENPFSFIAPIQKFLNSPMPQAFDNKFQYTPSLAEYIKSIGINSSQALINIQNIPKTLSPEAYEIPGVWKAYTKGIPVRNSDGQFTQISNITVSSALAGNTSNLIYQTIKVSPRINITVSLKSDLSESKGSFNGRDIYFRKEGDRLVADITVPRAPGTYYVSTGATPIDLAIQVIGDTPTTIIDQVKPATIWGKIRSFFGW